MVPMRWPLLLLLGCACGPGARTQAVAAQAPDEPRPSRFHDAALGQRATSPSLPHDGLDRLVAQVLAAAEAGDLSALGALMDDDFDTSMMGDRGPKAGVTVLAERPEQHLTTLATLLRGECVFVDTRSNWMCPAGLVDADVPEWGGSVRAHFQRRDGRWSWVAFIVDEAPTPGAASAPRPAARPPTPSQSRIVVTVPPVEPAQAGRPKGKLPKDVIRATVRASIADVRRCYNEGLARDPNLTGRVAIQFTIGPQGTVTAATVEASQLPDAEVDNCIADVIKALSFPPPQGGGNVVVTYPFVLQPG